MFDYNPDLEKFSLKYSKDVPKGYDVSPIQYTFDFVYQVLKADASIDGAIKTVADEYGLSQDYLMEYLVENKYILNKTRFNDFSMHIKKYNTKSLKKILKKQGLKTSGKRERLEKRLYENGQYGKEYKISSKSRVFYKNKKRRNRIFTDCLLDYYYFNEFNDFYMDNYRKKEAKIPVEFISRHIDKAIDDENHRSYILNNQIMAEHFLVKEKYRKMLEHVLKVYCMNLNPIWKIDELKGHAGLSLDTYNNLIFLEEKLGKNAVISNFYLVWDSFDFERIIVSKYDAYRYLKAILNRKDFTKINASLDGKFYMNDDLKIKRITQKTLFDF